MITVKETNMEGIVKQLAGKYWGYYWTEHKFVSLTNDKTGTSLYFVDGKESTKDAGNKLFLDAKKSNYEWRKLPECKAFLSRNRMNVQDTFKVVISTQQMTLEEVVDMWKSKINDDTLYIDDHSSWTAATSRNAEIKRQISKIESTFGSEQDDS